MSKEALKMCLEYIETDAHERKYVRHAIKEALISIPDRSQPEQEPAKWVGLTQDEQDKVFKTFSKSDAYKRDFLNRIASAIEAKLKEKNI